MRPARDQGDVARRPWRAWRPSRPPIAPAPKIAILIRPGPASAARPMRCSLPVAPFGISARITIAARHLEVGEPAGGEGADLALVRAQRPRAARRRAATSSPSLSCGMAKVTTWATAGWSISTSSTSSGLDLLAAAVDDLLEPAGDAADSPRRRCMPWSPVRNQPSVGRRSLGVGVRVGLVAGRHVGAAR